MCFFVPATGVYITRTRDTADGRVSNPVTNIGYRPTFGDSTELTVETFLHRFRSVGQGHTIPAYPIHSHREPD